MTTTTGKTTRLAGRNRKRVLPVVDSLAFTRFPLGVRRMLMYHACTRTNGSLSADRNQYISLPASRKITPWLVRNSGRGPQCSTSNYRDPIHHHKIQHRDVQCIRGVYADGNEMTSSALRYHGFMCKYHLLRLPMEILGLGDVADFAVLPEINPGLSDRAKSACLLSLYSL